MRDPARPVLALPLPDEGLRVSFDDCSGLDFPGLGLRSIPDVRFWQRYEDKGSFCFKSETGFLSATLQSPPERYFILNSKKNDYFLVYLCKRHIPGTFLKTEVL